MEVVLDFLLLRKSVCEFTRGPVLVESWCVDEAWEGVVVVRRVLWLCLPGTGIDCLVREMEVEMGVRT